MLLNNFFMLEGGAVAGTGVGSDFIPVLDRAVVFPRQSTKPRFGFELDIAILDDGAAEDTEYFEVHFFIDFQSVNSGGYALSSVVRVTIFDDDGEGLWLCLYCSFRESGSMPWGTNLD